jgi:hypothetical protein
MCGVWNVERSSVRYPELGVPLSCGCHSFRCVHCVAAVTDIFAAVPHLLPQYKLQAF